MSKSVGIREAKARFSHYVDLVRGGEEVVITDRGHPVVRLVAVASSGGGTEEDVLDELEQAGLLERGSGKRSPLPRLAALQGEPTSISSVVRAMRR